MTTRVIEGYWWTTREQISVKSLHRNVNITLHWSDTAEIKRFVLGRLNRRFLPVVNLSFRFNLLSSLFNYFRLSWSILGGRTDSSVLSCSSKRIFPWIHCPNSCFSVWLNLSHASILSLAVSVFQFGSLLHSKTGVFVVSRASYALLLFIYKVPYLFDAKNNYCRKAPRPLVRAAI